jgi:peroxiredoxin family protein
MEASLFYTFWEDGRLADRPVEEGKSTEEPTRKGEDAPGSKELHRLAKQRGVRLVTLDVMAIREDDLCDDIEVGSTATYLAQASQSGLNLVL